MRQSRDFPQPGDFLLKAKKAEMVLDAGLPLAGQVLDDRGRPIAGARVRLGAEHDAPLRSFPSVATDPEGRFRFDHIPAGTQTLTTQAPGRAPELADVVVAPGMRPVEFRLGPGHRLRGRIVDSKGKPLDGVTIEAANWRARMSLEWMTRTDAEGRFTWDSAPVEPVLLTLTRPGYTMIVQREFRPDRDETTVTMYPPLRVRGQVTDARTSRPIERFKVVTGAYWRGANRGGGLGEPGWERGWHQPDTSSGTYEVEYSHPQYAAVAVRIEAEGYVPATSEPFRMEAGSARFDARLEPGVGPSGVVHGPDGRPLAGAAVILSTKSARAELSNGKFHEGAYPRVVAGPDGRFSFPPQTEPFRVFVDHEDGFAEADEKALANGSPLTIRPWGRIQGTAKIGSRLAAGVQIGLDEINAPLPADQALPIRQTQGTQTDTRGRYVFERVIPARLHVRRCFTPERAGHVVASGCTRTVVVGSGRTAFADLGGTGQPVIGRFELPAGIKAGAIFPSWNQILTPILPEPPYPANLNAREREAWLAGWQATPEGIAYSEAKVAFDTNVRPDGRFRIEDVPDGRFELHAQVHEPGNGVGGTAGRELANVDVEITVPEIPGGRSDKPLDLGTIKLKPFTPPERR